MPRSSTRRGFAGEDVPVGALDHLEPRIVFSAPYDFVAVGLRFDSGPQAFFTEGVIAGDDSITGTTRFADSTGAGSTDPIDWTSLMRGADGSFTFGTRAGFTPYGSQSGNLFLWEEERRHAGTFVGTDAMGALRDFAVLGQPENAAAPNPLFSLDMAMTRVTASGTVETFNLTILRLSETGGVGATYRFVYALSSGDVTTEKTVAVSEHGRLEFDTGEVLIVPQQYNSERTPAFLADLNAADNIVGIAIGRYGGHADPIGDSGRFRSAALVDGPLAAQFLGINPASVSPGHPAAARVLIELNFWNLHDDQSLPNTFRVFRQDEWDMGMRTPITEGVWNYATDDAGLTVIRMESGAGPVLTVRSTIPRVLTFVSVSSGTDTELLQGLGAAPAQRGGAVQEVLVHIDNDGHPIAYVEHRENDDSVSVYSVDLVSEVGGEAVTGSIVTWLGSPFGGFDRTVAARSVSGDVLLWRLSPDGTSWSFANLTAALPGARRIDSDLFNTGTVTSNSIVGSSPGAPLPVASVYPTLAGYDAAGNFVVYRFSEATPAQHASRWEFIDVKLDGVGGAGVVPDVVGGLVGWSAAWGGVHFAGVDADGELWSIWWAPGLDRWHADNLSVNAGAPVLAAARPAVAGTAWSSFHLAATDVNGHVISVWWAVGFDHWRQQDLTADFGGAAIQQGTLASNYSFLLGNINILGLDGDGRAAIYWWSQNTGWQVNTITQGLFASDVPNTPWTLTWSRYNNTSMGQIEHTQSVLGASDTNHLVRLVWRSLSADSWMLEDITAMSVPYGV